MIQFARQISKRNCLSENVLIPRILATAAGFADDASSFFFCFSVGKKASIQKFKVFREEDFCFLITFVS